MRYPSVLIVSLVALFFASSVQAQNKVRVTKDAKVMVGTTVVAEVKAGQVLDKLEVNGDWVGVKVVVNGVEKRGWIFRGAVQDVRVQGSAGTKITADAVKKVGAMAIVRIHSINSFMKKVQAFAGNINPMLAGVVSIDALLMRAPKQVRDGIMGGIDFDAPVAVIVYPPEMKEGVPLQPKVCALIPVKDANALQRALDAEGAPIPDYKISTTTMFVGSLPGLVDNFVREFGESVSVDVSDVKSDLHVTVFTSKLSNMMITQMENQMRMFEDLGGSDGPRMSVMRFAMGLLKDIMKDLEKACYELEFKPTSLHYRQVSFLVKGSPLAQTFAKLADSKAPDISPRIPSQGAMAMGTMQLGGAELAKLCKNWFDEATKVIRETGTVPADKIDVFNAIMAKMRDMVDIFTGNAAFAVVPSGTDVAIVTAVGKKPGTKGIFDSVMEIVRTVAQSEGEPVPEGITRQVAGVTVTSFAAPDGSAQLDVAELPDVSLFILGKNTANFTQLAINTAKTGKAGPSPLQAVASQFRGKKLGLFSISLLKCLHAAGQAPLAQIVAPHLQLDKPLTIVWGVNGNQVVSELKMPVEPIRAIQPIFMQTMMRRKGGGQGGPPGPPPDQF